MAQHTANTPEKCPSAAPEVMIFGSGVCARKIATNLADRGIDVILAAQDDPAAGIQTDHAVTWLSGAELDHCRGVAGNFQLKLKQRARMIQKSVSAIVVAEDTQCLPNHVAYGLSPGPRILDIATLEAVLGGHEVDDPFKANVAVAFLCGWHNDAQPSVSLRMLNACSRLQGRSGITTYFLTGNLKVAAFGAEKRVEAAKRAGTLFFKFTVDFPAIVSGADSRFAIEYTDELTRMPFRLEADWIIVDETIGPGEYLAALAQRLCINGNGLGFAQADNVRRLSNATNRRGIFVAGGGRGVLPIEEQLADADQASLAVTGFLEGLDIKQMPPPAIVQRGRCARCLPCHRLCPHGAVEIGGHIAIAPEACQRCGICAAGCPAHAIEMEGVPNDADISRVSCRSAAKAENQAPKPLIVVLGCARSAGQALALIHLMGKHLPEGVQFVEVPCGGSIASRHLLSAFDGGADGVMVCVCHTDNCLSQSGNRIARRRTAEVQKLLQTAGLERKRLCVAAVAANMGTELASRIDAFASEIGALAGR